MTEEERAAITEERFDLCRRHMRNAHATPFFCIGLANKPSPEWGHVVIWSCADVKDYLPAILRQIAKDLEKHPLTGEG